MVNGMSSPPLNFLSRYRVYRAIYPTKLLPALDSEPEQRRPKATHRQRPRAITPRGAIPCVRGVLRFRSERRPVVCSRYRTSFLERNTVAGILSTGSRRRKTHLRRICFFAIVFALFWLLLNDFYPETP